jgi:hypothetical protein
MSSSPCHTARQADLANGRNAASTVTQREEELASTTCCRHYIEIAVRVEIACSQKVCLFGDREYRSLFQKGRFGVPSMQGDEAAARDCVAAQDVCHSVFVEVC